MLLAKPNVKNVSTVAHEGKMLIVASVAEQSAIKLYYTIKQDGFEDSALQNPGGSGWEAFKAVPLPNDSIGDRSVEAKEQAELTDTQGNRLLRSVYKSAHLTADAPVQLVSHNGFVYLFRQSTNGTLLADRFALDGMTNTLTPKLEVRYKRSRERYQPIKAMKINGEGRMESVDALDFRDMQNRPFFEPTTEIYPELKLHKGWFAAAVTPTNEPDGYRWHFFIDAPASHKLEILTLRADAEAMFTVRDYWYRTLDPEADTASYDCVPGLIRRSLALTLGSTAIEPTNGPAAIKYDVQREQHTQVGSQLVREEGKLLLAVPTGQGIAALSFAIAADGTLAQISQPQNTLLRGIEREILLPTDLLENIVPLGQAVPPPSGTIVGVAASREDSTADRLQVVVDPNEAGLGRLKVGDRVSLSDTASHNGLYQVQAADGSSFTVKQDSITAGVGNWEKIQPEGTGLVYDGQITGYQKAADGELKVQTQGLGLVKDDAVQIINNAGLDGEYEVIGRDAQGFTVQRLWAGGEALSIKREAAKRRGLIFDGQDDWIEIPLLDRLKLGAGFLIEAWVKLTAISSATQTLLATAPEPVSLSGLQKEGWQLSLRVVNGNPYAQLQTFPPQLNDGDQPSTIAIFDTNRLVVGKWTHIACGFDGTQLTLYRDGQARATKTSADLINAAEAAKSNRIKKFTPEKQTQEQLLRDYGLVRQPAHPACYDGGKLLTGIGGRALSGGEQGLLGLANAMNRLEQYWRVIPLQDPTNSATLLKVNIHNSDGSALNHSIRLANPNPSAADQMWRVETLPDGNYRLRAAGSGRVLHISPKGEFWLVEPLALNSSNILSQTWRFEPFGITKINRIQEALQAASAPVNPKAPIIVNTGALTLAGRTESADPGQALDPLQGQLAEVRVWTVARTPKQIRDAMYLPLTGRETGLAGYWRLGGIAKDDDGQSRVFDFSIAANHGRAHGSPYAGGVSLLRQLGNGQDAVSYRNSDLFAVSEGALYVESFEFRVQPGTAINNPQNVGGGKPIFKPALWGRLSRNSEHKVAIDKPETFEFTPLGDGWFRASCRFMVPQGLRLLRCFDLAEVSGNWANLEIQRHTVKRVSDSITLASSLGESATLAPLVASATGQSPEQMLAAIGQAEIEEAALQTRKLWLDDQIHLAQNTGLANNELQKQNQLIITLTSNEAAAKAAYEKERDNPLNYECNICGNGPGFALLYSKTYGAFAESIRVMNVEPDRSILPYETEWAFERQTDGRYKIKWAFGQYVTKYGSGFARQGMRGNKPDALFDLKPQPDGSFRIEHQGSYLTYSSSGAVTAEAYTPFGHGQNFRLVSTGRRLESTETDQIMQDLETKWRTELGKLQQARIRRDELTAVVENAAAQEEKYTGELTNIKTRLDMVQVFVAQLNTGYLAAAANAQNTAQAMPDLAGQSDPRSLKVQGALLPCPPAASRLHAVESCAGRVSLSYQDRDGRLRQAHYDAAYDADGKGEEWLPDTFRTAVELVPAQSLVTLPVALFQEISTQITIEFWAKGGSGLPKALGATLLAATPKGQAHIACLRIRLPNENDEVVWEAGRSADGRSIDSLNFKIDPRSYRERWTHWAFVKDCAQAEMRIYCNGQLLHKNLPKDNKNPQPLKLPITGVAEATLGGFPKGTNDSRWPGQIAELRIWSVALGERELECNSVLTLTGNEPGLVAYYPMNEAQGTHLRDHTGHGYHLTLASANWRPCPALGQPLTPLLPEFPAELPKPLVLLDKPISFDGSNTYLPLPSLNLGLDKGFTLETRASYQTLKLNAVIFDLGNGAGIDNIFISNDGATANLRFMVQQGNDHDNIIVNDVFRPGRSVHVAVTMTPDKQVKVYVDGVLTNQKSFKILPNAVFRSSSFIGKSNWDAGGQLHGQIEHIRFWEAPLSAEQIQLLALRPPLVGVAGAEYSRMTVDAQGRKAAMMMRSLVLADAHGVRLLDEQRIEELDMQWIGNAQIKPTLIGYIEGAPPLPSENLTEEQDYNNATSVELVQSSDVTYSWTREQDISLGSEIGLSLGMESESTAGLGFETTVESISVGFGADMNFANSWQNASTVSAGHSLSQSDKLSLRGTQEQEPHFPHLGKRFIPKNVGYALVTSGLADVFVSKLRRSGRMVAYQVLPVEGVPLDVNTITFMINPAYTMAGSLDGMTGSRATSERFFRQVPEMRAQYGSLYPASYFRLEEAYALKSRIDKQDREHQAYFNQFDAGRTDEASLNQQIGDTSGDEGLGGLTSMSVNAGESSDEIKEIDKRIKEKDKRIKELNRKSRREELSSAEEDELDRLEDEVEDLRERQSQLREREQDASEYENEQRQEKIESVHSDLSKREHAAASFAGWQRKMEGLQIRAGKRNIVNTYVWDGDGGFHAEEQQFASSIEHTIGGSFDMGIALGGDADVSVLKVAVGVSAYANFNMTQTMSKTEASSKGMELRVDLEGVESRGITDHHDYPILPGEKVDRYRFMSFYLENDVNHWHDFFNQVVDPEWLASNDEEARALRQAQAALPNKVWRVLHRVTYVERPALMGFGRQAAPRVEVAGELQALSHQIAALAEQIDKLAKTVETGR